MNFSPNNPDEFEGNERPQNVLYKLQRTPLYSIGYIICSLNKSINIMETLQSHYKRPLVALSKLSKSKNVSIDQVLADKYPPNFKFSKLIQYEICTEVGICWDFTFHKTLCRPTVRFVLQPSEPEGEKLWRGLCTLLCFFNSFFKKGSTWEVK